MAAPGFYGQRMNNPNQFFHLNATDDIGSMAAGPQCRPAAKSRRATTKQVCSPDDSQRRAQVTWPLVLLHQVDAG